MLLTLLLLTGVATVAVDGCKDCKELELQQEITKQDMIHMLKDSMGFDPAQQKPIPAEVKAKGKALAHHSEKMKEDKEMESAETLHIWGKQDDDDEDSNVVVFSLNGKTKGRGLEKAHMHLYVDKPETNPEERREVSIEVYEASEDGVKGELLASHRVLTPVHGYAHHKIRLNSEAIERIVQADVAKLIVEAIVDGVNLVVLPGDAEDANDHPLSLALSFSQKRRSRRAIIKACKGNDANQACCVLTTILDFAAMGWDHVASPSRMIVTGCWGTCKARAPGNYSLPPALAEMQAAAGVASSCCHPTGYEDQEFVFFDRDDNINQKILKNAYVVQCGCA